METTCREFSKKGRKRIARRRTGFSHNCSTVRRVQRNNKKRGGILYKFLCMEGIIERTVKLQCDRRTHWVSSLQTLPPPSLLRKRGGRGEGKAGKGEMFSSFERSLPVVSLCPSAEKRKRTHNTVSCVVGFFLFWIEWEASWEVGYLLYRFLFSLRYEPRLLSKSIASWDRSMNVACCVLWKAKLSVWFLIVHK